MLSPEDTNALIDERKKEMLETYGRKAYMLMLEILMLHQNLQEQQQKTRMIYLSEWGLYHSRPTVSAMRNLISRRKENGFDAVVSKDGKLWLIDENKYFEWRKRRSENDNNSIGKN